MQAIPSRLLPRRLHHQLALLFAILFALAIAVYAKYTGEEQYRTMVELLQQQARRWVAEMAEESGAEVVAGDRARLEARLLRLAASHEADHMAVFGADGRLLAAVRLSGRHYLADPEFAVPPLPTKVMVSAVADGPSRFRGGRSQRILAWAPVEQQGRVAGWVRAEFDSGPAEEARAHILGDSLVVGLLTIVSATLMVFFFLRTPLGSLRKATAFANQLHSRFGDVEDFSGAPTEIRELGDALNWASLRLYDQNAALSDGERRKSAILDAALDCIIAVDKAGCITEFNPAAERTFGYRRDEVVGRTMIELLVPPRLHEVTRKVMQQLAGGAAELGQRRETVALRRDGSEFPVEVAMAAIELGGSLSFIGYLRDITAEKQAQAALQQAKEVAEQANQAKGDFLANMSHEIRTPMNAILGMTDLALDTRLDAEQREYLSLVKTSADALLAIINDILDFSKIEAGRLDFESIPFGLRECVSMALRTLASKAAERGLQLRQEIADDVPDHYRGDPYRLRQILINLVGNALKFTERGEVCVIVRRDGDADGAALHFAVRDTGIGIPADKQRLIFEAFSQADSSTTRRFGGTGLGLTICQRLVAMMGGRIWVESRIGLGSTFHFTAGLEKLDGLPASSGTENDLPTVAPVVRPLHILLAEDNPVNQTLAVRLLEKLGHRVTVVGNGADAVAESKAGGYDAILMDVQMPVLGGFEATARIRSLEAAGQARIPIIAMTAHAMEGDRQRCLAAGMDGYVSKPIQTPTLVAALADVTAAVTSAAAGEVTAAAPVDTPADKPAVARSGVAETPLFDRTEVLANLGDDEDLLATLAGLYIKDLPQGIAALRAAAAAGDGAATQSAAHALKGAAGNFGAAPLVAALAAIERAGLAGVASAVLLAQVDAVTVLLNRLAAELQA